MVKFYDGTVADRRDPVTENAASAGRTAVNAAFRPAFGKNGRNPALQLFHRFIPKIVK